MNSAPVFIVGVPRSGTTLLAALLGSHSCMSCGPETHFFRKLARVNPAQLCRAETWPEEAIKFIKSITHRNYTGKAKTFTTLLDKYHLSENDAAEFLKGRKPGIPNILSSITEQYMSVSAKNRWVEKTPDHIKYLSSMRTYYPDSPIIRVVRDPRDTALSLMNVPWGPKTFLEALLYWRGMDQSGEDFFRVDDNCYTVRFEDLVRTPRKELMSICSFIGEKFEDTMLDTSLSGRSVNSRDVPWKKKAGQPLDSSRCAVWRSDLETRENWLAEAFLGERMKAYGYEILGRFPEFADLYPEGVDLLQYEKELESIASTGIRFWMADQEKTPRATVFMGDPGEVKWLGRNPIVRIFRTVLVSLMILTRILQGRILHWIPSRSEGKGWRICPSLLNRLLETYRFSGLR